MNQEDVIREIQEKYRQLGRALNEFERRHWAAMEAMNRGRGGIATVSKALRISTNTIKKGMQEIATGQSNSYSPTNARIRKPGGGRKSKSTSLDRVTRTSSNNISVDTETESSGSGLVDQNQPDPSPISIDLDSIPANENAPVKSPNPTEIP